MTTNLIDRRAEREPPESSAPAPAAPPAYEPSRTKVTYVLKVKAKVGGFLAAPCWHSPIQLTMAGDDVTITGAYRRPELARRVYRWTGIMLAALGVAVLGGLLIDRSGEGSTGANVGVAIFLVFLVLSMAAAAKLLVGTLREVHAAKKSPRVYVFPASTVTFVSLERYGSPTLLVFLLIFGGLLPGWLVWRFLCTRMKGLRITAPFDPDKPGDPETYRLVARNNEEAGALAQVMLAADATAAS